jgi:hypothetical protein
MSGERLRRAPAFQYELPGDRVAVAPRPAAGLQSRARVHGCSGVLVALMGRAIEEADAVLVIDVDGGSPPTPTSAARATGRP